MALDEATRSRADAKPDTAPAVPYPSPADAPAESNTAPAGDADEHVRALLAQKLASLAPLLSAGTRTQLQQHTLDMLTVLAEDEAVRVRAAIAQVVKNLPDVPRALILRLAHDDAVTVCEPVIRFSPLLTSDDLIALVAAAPSSGTRLAVARRPAIDAAVSDAVASGGTSDTILALLMNGSAQIREATLDALVERSIDQPAWHEPLVRRPALSEQSLKTLSRIVADHLLEALAARGDLDPVLSAELRSRVVAHLEPEPRANAPVANEGKPAETDILDAARDGDARKVILMLAAAADMPLPAVRRAVTLRSAKGLVSLAWKAGFTMKTGYAMQVLLAGLSPGATIKPGPGNGFPLSVQEMCWHLDFLNGKDR